MGGPKRPDAEETLRRMRAWADEWQAVAASTEPADRSRAEAAIASLYRDAGRPEPEFAWVPSPAAGLLAYSFASLTRDKIVSPYARGDIGNGDNVEFNGLAQPFGLEPAWSARLAGQVREQIEAARRSTAAQFDRLGWSAAALGLGGTARPLSLVQREALEAARAEELPAGTPDGSSVDVAAGVLGPAWLRLVECLGADLAQGLFAEATRRLAKQVLVEPVRLRNAVQAMQPGQWDAVTPVLAAARDVFGGFIWRHKNGRAERERQIDVRLEIARSAGPWWALDGLAIVSDRPVVMRRDDRARPHAPDDPAIAWRDGVETYAWHGVMVEPWVIREPERISVEAIDKEDNAEIRRILVERFGEARLVREGGAELVHEDETGRLWRRQMQPKNDWFPSWRPREEPIVMVEVTNSTPEPDGTRKIYFLRVPPIVTTARQAVAWTFGLGAVEYRPAAES